MDCGWDDGDFGSDCFGALTMPKKLFKHKVLSFLLGAEIPLPEDTTAQEVGLPHILRNDPEKLYELCRDQILQMTEMMNANVLYMREIKNTIFSQPEHF